MKRSEILAEFQVDEHGIIRSPGKFEGEMLYAPHFAEFYGSGEMVGVDEDDNSELYDVSPEDRAEFPEIDADTVAIVTWESDQGFFYCRELTAAELADLRAELESEQSEDAGEA